MSRYGTKCSWGEPPCSHMFRAPSLHLLHTQVLDHLRERHAETPDEVAGFYVEWEDAAGVWHRLPAERIGSELIAVAAEVRSTDTTKDPRERAEYLAASNADAAMGDWRPANETGEDG